MDVARRALTYDVKQLSSDSTRAQGGWDAVHQSDMAMTDLVVHLMKYKKGVAQWIPNRPHDAEAPQTVTAGFMQTFLMHMPIMAGCRYNPSEEDLNSVVDSLLRPITWDTLSKIIGTAMDNLLRLIAATRTMKHFTSISLLECKRKLAEARLQNLNIRRTCLKFRSLDRP